MKSNKKSPTKKVFIFSWGYPSKTTKGNPFVEDAVHLAHENGVDTTVIIFDFVSILGLFKKNNRLQYLSKRGEKIKVLSLYNIPFTPHFLKRFLFFFQTWIQIKSLIAKEGKPDLLQQHYIFHSSPFLVDFISKKFNIPYVLFEHSPVYSPEHFEKKINTYCYPYLSKEDFFKFINQAKELYCYKVQIDTLSHYFKRPFKSFDGFLPNYLLENTDAQTAKIENKKFTFCCIGTLDDRKGTLRLIEAFSKMKMTSECQLIFCGAGPFLEKAKNMISQLGLEDSVFITGFIPRKDVIGQLKVADFVVIASSYETFGMTCIEALAYGIPVVSTKCGGPETILNEEVGILCERDNIDSLTEALEKAFESKMKFSPALIQKYFHENYSEARAWSNLKGIYDLHES